MIAGDEQYMYVPIAVCPTDGMNIDCGLHFVVCIFMESPCIFHDMMGVRFVWCYRVYVVGKGLI